MPVHDIVIRGGALCDSNDGQVLRDGEHTGATPRRFGKDPGWIEK